MRDGVERVGFRGDDTLLVMNWLQPGMTPGPHSHPFEQIAVIVQGTARFHIGDKTYDAGPGSMIRIPPDVEHWAEVIGDEPVMNLDVFNPIREDYKHRARRCTRAGGRECFQAMKEGSKPLGGPWLHPSGKGDSFLWRIEYLDLIDIWLEIPSLKTRIGLPHCGRGLNTFQAGCAAIGFKALDLPSATVESRRFRSSKRSAAMSRDSSCWNPTGILSRLSSNVGGLDWRLSSTLMTCHPKGDFTGALVYSTTPTQSEGGKYDFVRRERLHQRWNHLAAPEIIQIAAPGFRRANRLVRRQFREICAAIQLLDQCFRFALSFHQDMPGTDFFLRREIGNRFFVFSSHGLIGNPGSNYLVEQRFFKQPFADKSQAFQIPFRYMKFLASNRSILASFIAGHPQRFPGSEPID